MISEFIPHSENGLYIIRGIQAYPDLFIKPGPEIKGRYLKYLKETKAI